MRFEGPLDFLEDLRVDDRVVATLALDAPAGHNPDVVVVAQHFIDAIAAERFSGPLRCRASPQTDLLKHLAQCRDRVLTAGECLEAELDQFGSLWIDGDRADLLPADHLTNVQVADRRPTVGATVGELAVETHLDLPAVRARPVCVDPGHDRVDEHPGVVVGDVLKRGLKLCAIAFDLAQQPEGVELVSGDARKVIEDDVGRLQVSKLGEHLLQLGASHAGRALTGLGVLLDNRGTEPLRMALTCLALSLDRVALLAAPSQLSRTGHAQINHGGCPFTRRHRFGLIFYDKL